MLIKMYTKEYIMIDIMKVVYGTREEKEHEKNANKVQNKKQGNPSTIRTNLLNKSGI